MPKFLCCQVRVCRPRYKRLVETAIPRNPSEGLNPVSMEKLYYYSLLYPEKMDQVGEYMYERAAKHLRKGRYPHVALTVDALAQLMSSADARGREQIVDSFLRTVLMCLASDCPRLQVTATYCFIRFVILKDETLYHMNYEQLLTEFADMCRNSIEDPDIQEEVRHAGIEGLEAILLWCDGLIDDIYSSTYMNVILPCLLYNLNDPEYLGMSSSERAEHNMNSPGIAESCMREVLIRTYASRLHYVLNPILRYFDENNLWWDALFPFEVFKLVIMSVEPTYAYVLIESLVQHASYDNTPDPTTRARILETVMEISQGANAESVGPSAFYCVGTLLHDLEKSVKRAADDQNVTQEEEQDEDWYQDTLVRTLETISYALPDYYKLEMMIYVVNRTPYPSQGIVDARLRYILLDLLGEVSRQYGTAHFSSSLPMNLLRPLLRISLSPNPRVRLAVHHVLHNLTDRQGNLEKLLEPSNNIVKLDLQFKQCSALDVAFMRRNGLEIFRTLYKGFECFNNSTRNVKAVYTSSALFILETVSEATLVETLRFLINIQDLTVFHTQPWVWKEDLELVLQSLLGLLLLVVPAAKVLKDKVADWARPLAGIPLLGPDTILHRLRVVACLRRDGWLGLTEHHLDTYAEVQDPEWPAGQRVTTVMHMTVPPAWRSLGSALSARRVAAVSTSPALAPSTVSMPGRRSSRLAPPVSPHTVEEENRWLFLTDVLMLHENYNDQDLDEEEDEDSYLREYEEIDHTDRRLNRSTLTEEDEDEEEFSSITSEEETSITSSSTGALPDHFPGIETPPVSRTLVSSVEREIVTSEVSAIVSHAVDVVDSSPSTAPGGSTSRDSRRSSDARSSVERENTGVRPDSPTSFLASRPISAPVTGTSCNKCSRLRILAFRTLSSSFPTTARSTAVTPLPTVLSGKVASLTDIAPANSSPVKESRLKCECNAFTQNVDSTPRKPSSTLSRQADVICTVSVSDKRGTDRTPAAIPPSRHSPPSTSRRPSSSSDTSSTVAASQALGSTEPTTDATNKPKATATSASISLLPRTSKQSRPSRQASLNTSTVDPQVSFNNIESTYDPTAPDDMLDSTSPNRAMDSVGDAAGDTFTPSAAPAPDLDPDQSACSYSATSEFSRRGTSWPRTSSGAAIIGRLKADAAITVAHRRLKFSEKQARLKLHYRTKPFDQLRPQYRRRSTQGEGGLQSVLATVLRDVPPPSEPPPPPTSLVPTIRTTLMHFIQDDIDPEENLLVEAGTPAARLKL